jgi:hypothetical protein
MNLRFLGLALAVTSAFATASLLACSSTSTSSSGGTTTNTTGVDSAKSLSGLSASDIAAICDGLLKQQSASSQKFACGYAALAESGFGASTDGEAQDRCKETLSACLATPNESAADIANDVSACENQLTTDATSCTATVGDLVQCQSDEYAIVDQLANRDWCSEAKAGGVDAGIDKSSSSKPASCNTLSAKCPSLGASPDASIDAGQ